MVKNLNQTIEKRFGYTEFYTKKNISDFRLQNSMHKRILYDVN